MSHCAAPASVLLVVSLLAAGCADDTFAPPGDMASCYEAADSSGNGDSGSIWVVAFDDTPHPLDEPSTIYACLGIVDKAAVVTVSDTDGVTVSPDEQRIAGRESKPAAFEVRLVDTDGGQVELTLDAGGSGGTMGVSVEVDGDEWSLTRP